MHDTPPEKTQNILLELKNLSVNYGGIQALQNINLTINAGEVVTLIGANGAGKSTTLRAISKIVNLRQGQIIYNGRDISRRQASRSCEIGNRPQSRRAAGFGAANGVD
jgi:branched-chain amino acid transport system ATP-binding protein